MTRPIVLPGSGDKRSRFDLLQVEPRGVSHLRTQGSEPTWRRFGARVRCRRARRCRRRPIPHGVHQRDPETRLGYLEVAEALELLKSEWSPFLLSQSRHRTKLLSLISSLSSRLSGARSITLLAVVWHLCTGRKAGGSGAGRCLELSHKKKLSPPSGGRRQDWDGQASVAPELNRSMER